jgi:hypothetical protein
LAIFLLIVPGSVWAAELTDCDSGTADCTCPPSSVDSIDETTFSVADDCADACDALSTLSDYDNILSYSLQCSVGGTLTVISQGELTLMGQAADYYYSAPDLGVEIPGLEFTDAYRAGNTISVNYFAEYINAVYVWLLSAGAVVAVVMVMIGGLQYAMAHGDKGKITKAKERISGSVVGIIILLCAYTIAYLIDPNTVRFSTLEIPYVAEELYSFPPYGEDLDIAPRTDISGDVTDIGGDHLQIQTSESGLNPDAATALKNAAAQFYAATGGSLRITSGYRTIEKQQSLYSQNCSSGTCSPPTCNPGNPADISNCPHTSSIAVDVWYSGGPGNYQANPALMQQVAEAMIANGFCRLGSEVWHFELYAKVVSTSCSTSNISPSYTVRGTTYTPTAGCTIWDFKKHRCIQ